MFGLLDVADVTAQLQAAIDLGDLTLQNAPAGHPLFAALDNGREVMAWLNENASILASGVGGNVQARVQAAIDAIEQAASTVRNDPDAGPVMRVFPPLQTPGLSWPWIAGGAALILGVAILFAKKGKR